jgi:vitamin B12 transporter
MKNSTQALRVPLVLSRTALSSLVASSLAVWATASLAQNLSPSDTQNAGNQVVVTANRIEQRVRDVVADVSLIDREELALAGASTVVEVLSRLPGVQITGDRVYIRGAEARMTAVYLDGVRIDSHDYNTFGVAPWTLIPAAQIDRIEVLRGAASAIYGSDSMGGVVQIFTRKATSGFSPYASAGLGGYGTQQTQSYKAGLSAKSGALDYALGAAYEDSQGYDTKPTLARPSTAQGFIANSFNLRIGLDVSATQRLEATALSATRLQKDAPSSWNPPIDSRGEKKLDTARVAWNNKWNTDFNSKFAISQSLTSTQDNNADAPNDYRTQLRSYLLENHLKALGGVVSAVLERKEDQYEQKQTVAAWDPTTITNAAINPSRFQNAVALGYTTKTGSHALQVNLRNDTYSLLGNKATGSIAYAYDWSSNLRTSASTSTGFKAPTLEQLYSSYGSTSLRPESNLNHELAIRHTQGSNQLRWSIYRNTFNDLISSGTTSCAYGSFCYYNVGQASINGTTLSFEHMLGQTRLHGSADWMLAQNDISGKRLSLRADRQAFIGFETSLDTWKLGADLRAVGERYQEAANTTVLPGYVLLSLKAGKPLNKDWRATARLDNATNSQYDTVGYNTASPGRSLFIGLQWQPS